MKYLEARDEQGRLKRASLAYAAPWARSVVVCAINYNTAQPYSTEIQTQSEENRERGWISRYAWSQQDYHDLAMQRLRRVEAAVRNAAASDDVVTRCYVDTGRLSSAWWRSMRGLDGLARILASSIRRWVVDVPGRDPDSLELAPGLPAPDRCGSCTRCIDACPTDALIAPHQLDSNKCIAYLTIEKRGAIAEEIRSGMGRHIFGCDICQDVCPWNRKAPATNARNFRRCRSW